MTFLFYKDLNRKWCLLYTVFLKVEFHAMFLVTNFSELNGQKKLILSSILRLFCIMLHFLTPALLENK